MPGRYAEHIFVHFQPVGSFSSGLIEYANGNNQHDGKEKHPAHLHQERYFVRTSGGWVGGIYQGVVTGKTG